MKKTMRKHATATIISMVMIAVCCGTSIGAEDDYTVKELNEQLVMATVWYQTAAEMRAISYQAFAMARVVFDMDLAKGKSAKSRAVIVDVDETVLDNSPYEAGLIGKDFGYPTGWQEWIAEAKAWPLPGAASFLNYVNSRGGAVFYISNRKERDREGTMKNLKDLGFPQVTNSHVLLRDKNSDKEPRRQMVRNDYHIVLLMGDNLNDFESVFAGKGVQDRFREVDKMKEQFGTRFIVLPNPMYGEWEGAIYNYDWKLSPGAKNKARKAALDRWNK